MDDEFFCSAFPSILLASISVAPNFLVLDCKLAIPWKSSSTFELKVYSGETIGFTFDGVWTHN